MGIAIANALDVDVNFLIGHLPQGNKKASDLFIESLLQNFTEKDKQFLIEVISAMKAYKSS